MRTNATRPIPGVDGAKSQSRKRRFYAEPTFPAPSLRIDCRGSSALPKSSRYKFSEIVKRHDSVRR